MGLRTVFDRVFGRTIANDDDGRRDGREDERVDEDVDDDKDDKDDNDEKDEHRVGHVDEEEKDERMEMIAVEDDTEAQTTRERAKMTTRTTGSKRRNSREKRTPRNGKRAREVERGTTMTSEGEARGADEEGNVRPLEGRGVGKRKEWRAKDDDDAKAGNAERSPTEGELVAGAAGRSRRELKQKVSEDYVEIDKVPRNAFQAAPTLGVSAMDVMEQDMGLELSLDSERLTDLEKLFVPEGFEQHELKFIAIRNALIVKWRAKPREYMSAAQAANCFKKKFEPLSYAVHKYLTYFGYINFGVMRQNSELDDDFTEGPKMSVCVIGAGLAGLGAARQLKSLGHKVVVLEASDRPGGRVDTREFETSSSFDPDKSDRVGVVADLGGSILSGTKGNPLCVIAKQLGIKPHVIASDCPLYDDEGNLVDDVVDKRVEDNFNKILENLSQYRELVGVTAANTMSLGIEIEKRIVNKLGQLPNYHVVTKERQTYDWHMANLEFANASRCEELSLRQWDQDDPYDFTGDHVVIPGGNARLVDALTKDLKIWYEHRVTTITSAASFGATGVIVHCEGVDIVADVVLVTVPLGVLKKECIAFVPALPTRKTQAVANIGFGILNKVVLVFPERFWSEHLDTFGLMQRNRNERGKYFLFYASSREGEGNVLLALIAGQAAIDVESREEDEVVMEVLDYLKKIFSRKNIEVPSPYSYHLTRWGQDENAYGSYSSCSMKTTAEDYDELAKPVGNIHFAGEATIARYPATLHGAYLSGLREAGFIAMKSDAASASDKLADITINMVSRP